LDALRTAPDLDLARAIALGFENLDGGAGGVAEGLDVVPAPSDELACGLPGALEKVCHAMGAPFGKDQEGYRLMLQMCRPRRIEADGTIVWCTLNFPGSWADGELAKRLYSLLEGLPAGFAIAADCAFNRSDMAGRIIRPLKTDELSRG
jgi:hypothetical protein